MVTLITPVLALMLGAALKKRPPPPVAGDAPPAKPDMNSMLGAALSKRKPPGDIGAKLGAALANAFSMALGHRSRPIGSQ